MRNRALVLTVLFSAAFGCAKKSEPPAEKAAESAAASAKPAPAGPNADTMKLASDLGQMVIPEDNPQSDEKVALGHQLFFDKRLSVDGSRSCYSCHQNEDGNGGKDPLAIGAKEKPLPRHSPVIWNVGYLPALYWDGRSATLEEQATAAWAGGNMGVGKEGLAKKAAEIAKIAGYKKQFDTVFPGKGVTPDTIVQAIAAYERTLVCDDTAYDRFAKGDKTALSDPQKRGLELFMGKAGCVVCHAPPHFSIAYVTNGGAYFNVGVGFDGKKPEEVDVGRKKLSNTEADHAAFKIPTLRNVSKSAPYFHDGSKKTLDEAVRFMSAGGHDNPQKSPLMTKRELNDDEHKSLIAFLGALDCNRQLEEPQLP